MKGQISRLMKDLENSEKKARDIKTGLMQHQALLETEYQETVSKLKKINEDSIRKFTDEKVCTPCNFETY